MTQSWKNKSMEEKSHLFRISEECSGKLLDKMFRSPKGLGYSRSYGYIFCKIINHSLYYTTAVINYIVIFLDSALKNQ